MKRTRLSALVVARNEEARISGCLETLGFADEVVVVLDRCTDRTKDMAEEFGARVVEGAWEVEGPRRNDGIAACTGDWILEVNADERVPKELADEIRQAISDVDPGYFLIPLDNYIGSRLVRHGWGGPGASTARRGCSTATPSIGETNASTLGRALREAAPASTPHDPPRRSRRLRYDRPTRSLYDDARPGSSG